MRDRRARMRCSVQKGRVDVSIYVQFQNKMEARVGGLGGACLAELVLMDCWRETVAKRSQRGRTGYSSAHERTLFDVDHNHVLDRSSIFLCDSS